MADTYRPLIGVTGPDRYGLISWRFIRFALWRTGARVARLTPAHPEPRETLDGLIVSGGSDIDPWLYAQEPADKGSYDRARDAFESIMIEEALRRHQPLLGICRGAQLLNVRLGGSLNQNLRDRRRYTSNRYTPLPLKGLILRRESRLAGIMDCEYCKINSLHSQGIATLGRELRVAGRDLDGIIQAVEYPGPEFILGVQWHPEYLFYSSRHYRLFSALVAAARRYRTRRD